MSASHTCSPVHPLHNKNLNQKLKQLQVVNDSCFLPGGNFYSSYFFGVGGIRGGFWSCCFFRHQVRSHRWRFHFLGSWDWELMATMTGCWEAGAREGLSSPSTLGLLAWGSPGCSARGSGPELGCLLTNTGGELEAWAARIWRGLLRAGRRRRGGEEGGKREAEESRI